MEYWKKQSDKPLFDDLIFSKPEQKSLAGKLGILGGNKLSFLAVANAYKAALDEGVGEVNLVLPDALKKTLGNIPGALFSPSNPSGGLAKEACVDINAIQNESNGLLRIGDAGKNTETQLLYEKCINNFGIDKPIIISRDAVDLLINSIQDLIDKPNIVFVLSFMQLQKIFRTLYYPIVLTHSMQTSKLVEAIHKFSLTYTSTICVFHENQILTAQNGNIISSDFVNPLNIWQGKTPAQIASWCIWNPHKLQEAVITAVYKK